MRDGRQRMPVHGMNMGKCPNNAGDTQSLSYLRVFVDVTWIIVVYEVVPECLAEHKPAQRHQSDADAWRPPGTIGSQRSYLSVSAAVHASTLRK
jgi:hypothetical protein